MKEVAPSFLRGRDLRPDVPLRPDNTPNNDPLRECDVLMGVEKTMDNDDDTIMLDDLFGPESDDDTEAAKVAPHPSQATKLGQHRKEVKG